MSLVVRTLADELKSKDPFLVFLSEMKTRMNQIKGIQSKLEYTQDITVPSGGRSEGLVLLWRKGIDV